MNQTKVSSKGQITIPKSIRERTGLKPGDKVRVEIRGEHIVIERMERPSESMPGIGRKTKEKLGEERAVELVREMRSEDTEEL